MTRDRSRLPRVVLASGSKFWVYHMARGAERAGMLHKLVTGFHDRREPGVPRHKIVSIPWPTFAAMLIARLPFPESQAWSYYVGDNWFDRAASRYAPEADIYHVYNHHGLHGIRAARRAGALTIVERASAHPHFQNAILREEFERFGLRYPSVNKQIVAKHLQEYDECDYIMASSDFVYRTMIAEGVPANKLVVLPLGFAPERFYPGEKSGDVFRVIFAGSMSLQKGLPYLLEGFRLANLPPDKSELVIVGGMFPDASAFLPKYTGLYRYVPFVPNSELPNVFRTGSVFVLPSLQDGFGMVVYEAAACGLPIIISENVGATIRDRQDGFVVPVRSAEAIAEKLQYLYTHEEERQRMGRSARQHVSQFTWERYQNELADFYRRIWRLPS